MCTNEGKTMRKIRGRKINPQVIQLPYLSDRTIKKDIELVKDRELNKTIKTPPSNRTHFLSSTHEIVTNREHILNHKTNLNLNILNRNNTDCIL